MRFSWKSVRNAASRSAIRRLALAGTAAAVVLTAMPLAVDAQVKPNADWRTITTAHFRVHFTPQLEELARRAATYAETAYVQLSRDLRPPRGPVDIVVSDDVDYSNGYASPHPRNRIVIYANPPITAGALRFVDDPTKLIVTHELTHIFQLDRVRGVWKALQRVFGRSPFFFPNAYQPSWLLEGFAVHFETKLTGSGRLAGSEHRMIARTAAMSGVFPRLDQLSLANPHFPYGYATYAYGSLFVEHLARAHGGSAISAFVESASKQLIPMWLDASARRAFGRSFTSEYAIWAESLLRSAPSSAPPMPGWRDLTVDGAYANFPRWLSDSTLVYTGTPGRESYGAYQLTLSGDPRPARDGVAAQVTRRRIGRRHTESPNTVLADGSLLYSQLEYTSPFEMRSDLYVDRAGGGTTRLTRGARLAIPDARRDGLIVAMQTVPGGTRLALVSPDGRRVSPITSGGLDEQWTEPRWSPDGRHIAAIRWTLGGTSSVVVVDSSGATVATLIRERALATTPSWSPDGRHVYFSSDRTGITNLYRAAFAPAFADTMMVAALQRVSDTRTGLFEPQPSPSGLDMAAVIFRADGYHVGIAPIAQFQTTDAESIAEVAPREPPPVTSHHSRVASHQSRVTSYSPWRSLLPSYWIPFWGSALTENSVRLGAFTSGQDLVGRHAYQAMFFVPTDNSGLTSSLYYRNARLGQPLIETTLSQEWENFRCIIDPASPNTCAGTLRRRVRDASLALTMQRVRARSFSYLSLGTGVEVRDYAEDREGLTPFVNPVYQDTHRFPRAVASFGWSNTQYPPLAISPEDGISLASTTRVRWRSGDTVGVSMSVVGTAAGFKSLDLPGYAHHVGGLRAAGGFVDRRGTSYLEVGGISGATLDVLPGYTLGEGRRSFGVRGFPVASLAGTRAYSATAEYRAPLTLPGRGLGTLPLFLDRTSVTLFGDAGTAWCPSILPTRPAPSTALCTQGDFDFGRTRAVGEPPFIHLSPKMLASAGAELNVTAAIFSWDAPFRYRFGVAVPVVGKTLAPGVKDVSGYFAVGASF